MTIEQRIFDWLTLNAPACLREVATAFGEYRHSSVRKGLERLRRHGYLAMSVDFHYSVPAGTPRPRDGRGGKRA